MEEAAHAQVVELRNKSERNKIRLGLFAIKIDYVQNLVFWGLIYSLFSSLSVCLSVFVSLFLLLSLSLSVSPFSILQNK